MNPNEQNTSIALEIIKASEIEPKEVKWLWYPYIPFGKLMLSIAALLSKGEPLPFTETEENEPMTIIYRYEDGKRVKHTVTPVLGEKAAHNGKVIYSLDFDVTPHQLRHTCITNLLYAGVDPKTVQYLAGHKNSKTTMDIYAKVKYNKPKELFGVVNGAFHQALAQ